MFTTVELLHNDDNTLSLIGLNAGVLIQDIKRIYKYKIDIDEPRKNKLFFNIMVNGVIFKRASITFNKYFALDIYLIFEKLYDITERSLYKEVLDLLKNEPNVGKYFTPILELPEDCVERMNQLNINLFDTQKDFIKDYYNAKNKLHLDGFILALSMGGGKTISAVAATYIFQMTPAIIIGPLAVLDGWKDTMLRILPDIKEEEIKMISQYNPNKDHVKWKYLISNYERINQALEYTKYAQAPIKCLLLDEAHAFRNLSIRTKALINLKNELDIHNIIAISGTPIKGLAVELSNIMKLIDPEYTDDAQKIFNRIYSRNQYDPITGSVLHNKLGFYMKKSLPNDPSLKLPPLEKYNVYTTISNPTPYLIETVKDNVWKYVNEHISEMKQELKPSYNKLIQILNSKEMKINVDEQETSHYKDVVYLKMNNPLDRRAIEGTQFISEYEYNLKKLVPNLSKEIISLRRICTSYMQILLGRGLGEFYVRGKIRSISQMVSENINEIAKIINDGETKTIIFSMFLDPLISIQESLKSVGINSFLHKGGDDVVQTRDIFKNDNTVKVLLGTIQALGTGVDLLQFIANQMIFTDVPYRYADLSQAIARCWRKGQPAKTVKAFFMHLKTDEPNILERGQDINEWSRQMVKLVME